MEHVAIMGPDWGFIQKIVMGEHAHLSEKYTAHPVVRDR
jgi:hypothetical protein